MTACVVDTNVLVVANQRNHEAGKRCRRDCIRKLRELMKNGVVVLDKKGEIFNEYKGAVPKPTWAIGREFIIHLYNHRKDPQRCELVPLTKNNTRGYGQFPKDKKLRKFPRKDRKFVAVAIASPRKPPICHATDWVWWGYENALGKHCVTIEHLCNHLAPTAAKIARKMRRQRSSR